MLAGPILAVLGLPALMGAAPAAASPSQDYVLYCMGCHGEEAQGVPGKIPPLAHSLARYMRSPAGRAYVLRVPGAANSVLSDASLAAVLNWLAQTYDTEDLSPVVPLFTAEEVSAWRRRPLLSVLATRRETIEALEATGPAPAQGY